MSKGVTLWFTGLSGSGKTSVARRVHELLQARHILSERLDGDVVRQSLCRDLGFSKEDRDKNIERVTFVSQVLTRNGVVVLCCFVSPYKAMRDNARHLIGDFLEIYVRTPLEVLVERDVKGMYKKAMAGEIQGFTGVNDPYEEPVNPELVLDTDKESIEESAARVITLLAERGYIAPDSAATDQAEAAKRAEAAKKTPGPSVPHGGALVDRELKGDARNEALQRAKSLLKFGLDEREMTDLEMIGYGALSPLTGFMRKADYDTVVDSMRLTDGLVWAMPVNLATSHARAKDITIGQEIALTEKGGKILAVMTVTDMWTPDKAREATACYGTTDVAHPGVARVMNQGDVYLGGPVWVIARPTDDTFAPWRQTPLETRRTLDERGWKTVVGFHTRDALHRTHEYLTKVALEVVDGLLLHPPVGATGADDLPTDVRMKTYDVMRERYYPASRVHLSVFPGVMRYAGPREALWHAIARKNYGCTHFIVGRDHAGVGNYYGSYDAQLLFDHFPAHELGIVPMKFENSWWCTRTGAMATSRTSSAGPEERLTLSATQVRARLLAGEDLPEEFTRKEVARILQEWYREQAPATKA